MNFKASNKRKIINDPVYGFIGISSDLVYDLIEHPYFQRLRRIKQLGLTNYVYPGATHTRFQHAIGAMALMEQAISGIQSKGHEITEEEQEAVLVAILLHDIGHGPFSHALEKNLVKDISHELLSEWFMVRLDKEFGGRLKLALRIFKNQYPKKFLYQLVSGQLDMDRLDYLRRDSFFTGVTEGVIGSDRIIKMLNVVDDQLVLEAKGIYSIEKFLIARRLMYWQVYLHKTVLAAEKLLYLLINRARYLIRQGDNIFTTPALLYFLKKEFSAESLMQPGVQNEIIQQFSELDDGDIFCAAKMWMNEKDDIIKYLSICLINRNIFKIRIQNTPFDDKTISEMTRAVKQKFGVSEEDTRFLFAHNAISNHAYSLRDEEIKILYKNNALVDVTQASDILNLSVLAKNVTKHFLCAPGEFFNHLSI